MSLIERGTMPARIMTDLIQWQEIAETWSGYPHDSTDAGDLNGIYWRCGDCDQSVYRLSNGHYEAYTLQPSEILSLKVAHIRQRHAEAINASIK